MAGRETILGQSGSFGVADVARIIVAQPAAARHVARRLYRTFISDTDEPPAGLLEPLAAAMRSSGDVDVARGIATGLAVAPVPFTLVPRAAGSRGPSNTPWGRCGRPSCSTRRPTWPISRSD